MLQPDAWKDQWMIYLRHSGIGSCSKLGAEGYSSYQDTFVWGKIHSYVMTVKTANLAHLFHFLCQDVTQWLPIGVISLGNMAVVVGNQMQERIMYVLHCDIS